MLSSQAMPVQAPQAAPSAAVTLVKAKPTPKVVQVKPPPIIWLGGGEAAQPPAQPKPKVAVVWGPGGGGGGSGLPPPPPPPPPPSADTPMQKIQDEVAARQDRDLVMCLG